ncbi:MAG: helix-turn-helix domain-containing protein, partial [Tissierellia bacterium]|nr:helix-turn-helix domain-containing protein [Tissierellia bacterium]
NQTNGNIAQAAKLMGISRQKLHYKIKKYNIK